VAPLYFNCKGILYRDLCGVAVEVTEVASGNGGQEPGSFQRIMEYRGSAGVDPRSADKGWHMNKRYRMAALLLVPMLGQAEPSLELDYGTFYSQMKTFAKGKLATPDWAFIWPVNRTVGAAGSPRRVSTPDRDARRGRWMANCVCPMTKISTSTRRSWWWGSRGPRRLRSVGTGDG
jgi:hypothetical protein